MPTLADRRRLERDYCLSIEKDVGNRVYSLACRTTFETPGFCLIDLGRESTSQRLRRTMLDLAASLKSIHEERFRRGLVVVSAGRFDQQTTTRLHRDGGPDESLLVLGYEPTPVRAELAMADYSRCAATLGMTPAEFLMNHNPMFEPGAQLLAEYTTQVSCFSHEHWQILVVNNSCTPLGDEPRWQGVLHTATMQNPDRTQQRIVNSMMLESTVLGVQNLVSNAELEDFADAMTVQTRMG